MSERIDQRIDEIPNRPKSDLGKYLYQQFLRRVIPGIIETATAMTEFSQHQKPKVQRQLRGAVGRLSRISAQAAAGRLNDLNFPTIPFEDERAADEFAARIGKKDAEIYPVPSSITSRLHDPAEAALDGIARESRIPGVSVLLTKVTAVRVGSTKRYFTVKIVGRNGLRQPPPKM